MGGGGQFKQSDEQWTAIRLDLESGVQSRFFTCIAAMKFWVDWVDWKTTTCKKLPRYYQPFWFTWIVVSLICVVYITLARRLCWEYSHWLIIFNQPIKIFLAKVEAKQGTARLMFFYSTTGEKNRFFSLEMQGVALERLLNDSPWSHAFVPPSILPTPAVAAAEYRRT